MHAATQEIVGWLLEHGRHCATVPDLVSVLMPRIQAHAPVDRFWIGTKVLHPQAAAYGWVWTSEGTKSIEFGHQRFAALERLDSPMRRLREHRRPLDYSSETHADIELQDIQALWSEGYTGFYARGLIQRNEFAGGFTWATRRPGGFDHMHKALFDGITDALSMVVEPLTLDQMYATLLRTYLGKDAGTRVAAGQVQRGDGEDLRAAVFFSDVRGFTALSARHPRRVVLELLDDVFGEVVDAVQDHGGQVLKFMGDGVLAVFPETAEHGRAHVCGDATSAALDLQARMVRVNARREAAGQPITGVGVGLHYGDLTYGNIGGPTRLDFTVIGATVNLAARVEGLCSQVGASVLATEAVASASGKWEAVGELPVKGVEVPVAVFRVA